MIGTGIFTSTGFMALDIDGGVPILFGWLVGGVVALCGAAVYGELGAMMPRAGGEYVYLSESFRPWVGFLSGWVSLFVGFSAPIAAAAAAFGFYLHAVLPSVPGKVAGVGIIVAMTAMHAASVAIGARVQTIFSLLKITLILVFIGVGALLGNGDWSNITAGAGMEKATSGAFAVSLVWIAFSYSGWNAAAYVAGEIKDPGRNLPRALLIGTGIVMALYLGLNAIFLYAAPPAQLAGVAEVGDLAARKLFGDGAGALLSSLIAIALVSSVSAMVMAGPRVYMAMAEDGMFFRALARKGGGGAPVGSVLLQGALAVFLLLIAKFDQLINYIGFTLSVFAMLTVLGALVLRIRRPEAPRPYRTFLWPVTPIVFVAISGWMAVYLAHMRPRVSLLAGGVTLLSGGAVYLVWQAWNRSRAGTRSERANR